jgi:hypothetical protein
MGQDPELGDNQRDIAINQHIVSNRHIDAFTRDGVVSVRLLTHDAEFNAPPQNEVFCAKRQWDEKTEKIRMKSIEDRFHREMDRIKAGEELSDHEAMTEYLLTWLFRAWAGDNEQKGTKLNGITPSDLTNEEKANLEANGVAYVDSDGRVPERFGRGLDYMALLDHPPDQVHTGEWRVVEVKEELLVSDLPVTSIIPIAPLAAVVPEHLEEFVPSIYNDIARDNARNWYFRAPT